MELENARKIKIDGISEEEFHALPPDELLSEAENEDSKPIFRTATDYAPTIKALREKNFTWQEIFAWFALNGVPYSYSSIRSAYRYVYEKK